jgi:5-methylcytosine-specific restriction protein A
VTWGEEKGRALPSNWESEIVPAIKKRDKGQCRWVLPSGKRCPRRGVEVDHVGDPDDHRLIKLRLLCVFHHGRRTSKQGHQAKAQRKAQKFRRSEDHPNR